MVEEFLSPWIAYLILFFFQGGQIGGSEVRPCLAQYLAVSGAHDGRNPRAKPLLLALLSVSNPLHSMEKRRLEHPNVTLIPPNSVVKWEEQEYI